MSQESIQQFFQMVSKDLELQEKLSATKDRETYLHYCVELGKENGYSFSTKEAEEFMELIAAQQQGELSDEELEAVAGGGFFQEAGSKVAAWFAKLRGKDVVKPKKGSRWPID